MMSRRSPSIGASAIRQANLRDHNLGLVLRLIVDAPVPVSRADIAVATGLTRATVSSLADQLIMGALVTELPPVMSQRAGRPAVPLVPAGGTLAAVGMEVNVDYLGVRVVDLSGAVLGQRVESANFRWSDPGVVLSQLSKLYCEVSDSLGAEIRLAGGCLAIPGLVDAMLGRVRLAPNLGWRDVDLVSEFHSHPERSAHGPRPTRCVRPACCPSCTSRARSASAARWWSTARFSVGGTAGAGRSATRWSIPPDRCAGADPPDVSSSTPARMR